MDQDKKNKTVIITIFIVLLSCLTVVGLWVFVPHSQHALNEQKEKSVNEIEGGKTEITKNQLQLDVAQRDAEQRSAEQEKEKKITQQKAQQDAVAAANLKLADREKEKKCGAMGLEYFRSKANPSAPQSIAGAMLIASHYNSRMSACLILVNSNRIAVVYDIKGDVQIMSSARGTTSFTPESELKEYITISTLMSE